MFAEGISGSPPGPGMSGAPRVVRRPSSTYVTPSRLAARRAGVKRSRNAQAQHPTRLHTIHTTHRRMPHTHMLHVHSSRK